MIGGVPTYAELKAVRMPDDAGHILVGVSDIDAQMRQEEEISLIRMEKTVISRISALSRGFICIYSIDPNTGHYVEYRSTGGYEDLGIPREGDDFFGEALCESDRVIHPDDRIKFRALMTKENVMRSLETDGFFSLQYRLLIGENPKYVNLKGALVEEEGKPVLIMGVNDIDAEVRHEQDFERKLSSARMKADLDVLTGVKTKSAYLTMSEHLTRQIEQGQNVIYAIVLCQVSGLSAVNETEGRAAGDRLIRDACDLICGTFKHSPVFRVAGDMFAVIAQSHDLDCLDSLLEELNRTSRAQGPLVAVGAARYDGSESAASVFARAEKLCTVKDAAQ
jgi:GGDEF domain-containing protein